MEMQSEGKGKVLDQFANPDNRARTSRRRARRSGSRRAGASRTSVSAMGTTGTIMGVSTFLKSKNPAIRVVGAQPAEGRRSRASGNGPRLTCPRSSTAAAWMLE